MDIRASRICPETSFPRLKLQFLPHLPLSQQDPQALREDVPARLRHEGTYPGQKLQREEAGLGQEESTGEASQRSGSSVLQQSV